MPSRATCGGMGPYLKDPAGGGVGLEIERENFFNGGVAGAILFFLKFLHNFDASAHFVK